MQIPRGPEDRYCPFWKQKMSKVCHTCPMWTQVRGVNPQTGADLDRWDCAHAIMPMLMVEQAGATRRNQAAIESMRNDIVVRMDNPNPQHQQTMLLETDDV